MTVTKACKCTHEFQDKEYGKGMRLHNLSDDKKKAYCTVCEGGGKGAKRASIGNKYASTRPYKNN